MKWVLPIFVLLSVSACTNSEEYCFRLREMAESEEIQNVLTAWVNENISRRVSTIEEEVFSGGGMSPGMHFIWPRDFDWTVLGFSNDAQVRLIGSEKIVHAVFFAERSRYGILINVSSSENFGLRDEYKPYVQESSSPNIATLCMERD